MTSVTLDSQYEVIIVSSEQLPNDEDFELWAQIFLHHQHINMIEFSAGADRHQWRFQFQNSFLNLNFEHYSNSVWIAPDGLDALELLPSLHQVLSD